MERLTYFLALPIIFLFVVEIISHGAQIFDVAVGALV